jgi:hypothetical protein
MNSPRLVRELGIQAIILLAQETSAEDAPDIFNRARRLVHYYRATPEGLPDWLENLVKTGYGHYASLLPKAFADQGTKPEQIAGMLGFIFTLESLALSLGCQRSQLLIGLQSAAQSTVVPDKLGLLWSSEWLLGLRGIADMRAYFADVLNDALRLPVLPQYLNGFVLALNFAPGIARFVVELLSHIFGSVADGTLLPWMPGLILQLRQHQAILQPLIKEAAAVFPPVLAGFANWKPAWLESAPAASARVQTTRAPLSPELALVRQLLFAHPQTTNAIAARLGLELHDWQDTPESASQPAPLTADEDAVRQALNSHPNTTNAVAARLDK